MALLPVGIHSNVVITKTLVNNNEQGLSLDITFKQGSEQPEADSDSLDFLNSGSITDNSGPRESTVRIYGVKTEKYGNTLSGDEVLNEVLAQKDKLVHIMNAFMTSDKIKLDVTKGLGVKNKSELVQKITDQATLDKVNENLFTQFVELMKAPIEVPGKTVTVKFVRQSKAKGFPKITDNVKYLSSNPFIADDKDEALKAKIKYSDYEKGRGDDSSAASLEPADNLSADELASQTEAVNNVFG